MSIKGFHLIFITIAAIFCGAFGVWALFINSIDDGVLVKFFGGVTLLAAPALAIYGVLFSRKSKKLPA